MGSCRNSKRPSLSDVTLYESPVATLTALILAPVTTAPEGSTTVPRILAYRLSAFAGVVQASPITKPTARSATLKRNACCFMKDPPTRILLTEADTERLGAEYNARPNHSTAHKATNVPKQSKHNMVSYHGHRDKLYCAAQGVYMSLRK